MTETSNPETCGKCGASWDGGPIPRNIREHYSPPWRWSRRIGLYDTGQDRTVAWRCPECGDEVNR
jgi:predicted RNA-binding Zn-ribbon protein involved in translation (DUF1610 family)